jgi:hypothetical protein
MKALRFSLLLAAVLSCPAWLSCQIPDGQQFMMQPDSIQHTLAQLEQAAPQLVGFIPQTGRRYIKVPRSSAVPEAWVERIQDAFYFDVQALCKAYGRRYLADWRALASKAARESFWGCSYLCNRTFNYFGIRHRAKEWICDRLGYCGYVMRNDPEPAAFAVFPSFERSLWVFIHTIYSQHFLERLPDGGQKVAAAIAFERANGQPYWNLNLNGRWFSGQLRGRPYSAEELIQTWSQHPINNLCVNCSWASDRKWVHKIIMAAYRARQATAER